MHEPVNVRQYCKVLLVVIVNIYFVGVVRGIGFRPGEVLLSRLANSACFGGILFCRPLLTFCTHSSFSSPEPGYYEDGSFGIRIENVVLVVPSKPKVPPLTQKGIFSF